MPEDENSRPLKDHSDRKRIRCRFELSNAGQASRAEGDRRQKGFFAQSSVLSTQPYFFDTGQLAPESARIGTPEPKRIQIWAKKWIRPLSACVRFRE